MSTASNDTSRDLESGSDLENVARQPRTSVPSILFISFVFFMLMNGRGDEFSVARDMYVNGFRSLNYQLGNFTAWKNGTESNFTLPSQDPNTMPLVAAFLQYGRELDPLHGSYYSNMTGYWHGDAALHNLTALNASEQAAPWRSLSEQFILPTNLTAIPGMLGPWNWTRTNKITLNVGDKLVPFRPESNKTTDSPQEESKGEEKDIAVIHGKVELSDPKSPDELHLDFEGIHVVSTGTVYAFAESLGHGIDIRTLPALVPQALQNDSAHAVEVELRSRISKLKERIDSGVFEQDSATLDDSPRTKCSFRLFAQLDASTVPKDLMEELENELEEPTGISTVKAPELALEGVLLSQDCGILYEIKHAVGVQTKRLYGKITTYSGISTLVNFILMALFRRQAAVSSTAAGLSRVSRYTFLIQSLIDAISFVGHVTVAILADGQPSLSVLAPAGLACLLFIYEAQFAIIIGQIQAHEDVTPASTTPAPAAPPQPQPQTQPEEANSAAPGSQIAPSLPAPATAPAPAPAAQPTQANQSFLRFLLNHIRTDPAARLWTLMSICMIVVFRVVIMLSLPLFFICSLYSSMWLVQIYRSARRTRSSGLAPSYLLGTTLCRLFFACYFLGCPKNIFDIEPRPWIFLVALLMLFQVGVLVLQEHAGPAFFLPQRVSRPQTYNYHPPLPLPDPEAPEQTLGDCAICMDAIEVDPGLRRRSKSGEVERRGFLKLGTVAGAAAARKSYSLAPCHHLFHTACLERWLAIKNICPQCRRPLPPL